MLGNIFWANLSRLVPPQEPADDAPDPVAELYSPDFLTRRDAEQLAALDTPSVRGKRVAERD